MQLLVLLDAVQKYDRYRESKEDLGRVLMSSPEPVQVKRVCPTPVFSWPQEEHCTLPSSIRGSLNDVPNGPFKKEEE